jgi:hypothetical protein
MKIEIYAKNHLYSMLISPQYTRKHKIIVKHHMIPLIKVTFWGVLEEKRTKKEKKLFSA